MMLRNKKLYISLLALVMTLIVLTVTLVGVNALFSKGESLVNKDPYLYQAIVNVLKNTEDTKIIEDLNLVMAQKESAKNAKSILNEVLSNNPALMEILSAEQRRLLATQISAADTSSFSAGTDAEKDIQNRVTAFLNLMAQDYTSKSALSFNEYFLDNSSDNYNRKFFISRYENIRRINAATNTTFEWAELTPTFKSIKIINNFATVNVSALMEYKTTGVEFSSSGKDDYIIELSHNNDIWFIQSVMCNDEYYTHNYGNVIEIESLYSSMKNINTDISIKKLSTNDNNTNYSAYSTLSYTFWNYLSGYYARVYAIDYNPLFYDNSGNNADCQNFASQCYWYGYGGSNYDYYIENRWLPMIVTSNSQAWWGRLSGFSSRWGSCTQFVNGFVNTSYLGPQGNYTSYPSGTTTINAVEGDIIQVTWTSGSVHAYIVGSTTGSNLSQIYVCAHTNDRYLQRLDYAVSGGYSSMKVLKATGFNE